MNARYLQSAIISILLDGIHDGIGEITVPPVRENSEETLAVYFAKNITLKTEVLELAIEVIVNRNYAKKMKKENILEDRDFEDCFRDMREIGLSPKEEFEHFRNGIYYITAQGFSAAQKIGWKQFKKKFIRCHPFFSTELGSRKKIIISKKLKMNKLVIPMECEEIVEKNWRGNWFPNNCYPQKQKKGEIYYIKMKGSGERTL